MNKLKFLSLCILLGATSLYAKELSIVTDKNIIGDKLNVSVVSHPKYDYDSIDLYQESTTGESTLLGNYEKGELDNKEVTINSEYKQSVIKGVVNNPKILNEGCEVYIKSNLPYYSIEGYPIDWGYVFSGLGTPTKTEWHIVSYNESNIETDDRYYTDATLPKTLPEGTHIVTLEYYDMYGERFESIKTVKITKKVEHTAKILVDSDLTDSAMMKWSYSFDGIAKKVNWYVNDELQETLPQRLSEGTHTLKLEVISEVGEIYTDTKEVNVKHVVSKDSLIRGGFPEGTKISTNVGTYSGNIQNLLLPTMYAAWTTTSYSATITLEFPKPIDINMFEIGKQATPGCKQSHTLQGYNADGVAVGSSRTFSYQAYDNRGVSEETLLANPYRLYDAWDDVDIKNCKKLVIQFNAGSSWGAIVHLGLGYNLTKQGV